MKSTRWFILLLLGVVSISCSFPNSLDTQREPNIQFFSPKVIEYVSRLPEIKLSRPNKEYLTSRLCLIGASACRSKIEFVVVKSNDPIAVVLSSQRIALSSGMIVRLHNSSELLFVIAHEVAHLRLEHFKDSNRSQIELELEADKWAIHQLTRTQHDPFVATSVLLRLKNKGGGGTTDRKLLELNHRLNSLYNVLGGIKYWNEWRSRNTDEHSFRNLKTEIGFAR